MLFSKKNLKSANKPGVRLKASFQEKKILPCCKKKLYIFIYQEPSRSQKAT